MSETKRLKNEGEATVRVEYAGNPHFFEPGEEREVPAELADSAQYRYSHLGIKIVTPAAKEPKGVKVADAILFVDEEAKAAEKAAKDTAAEEEAKAKADARADAKADAAEARAEAKAAKATPHPDELSGEFAPDLEVAKDRHEEPAWSPPAESPDDPPPFVTNRPDRTKGKK